MIKIEFEDTAEGLLVAGGGLCAYMYWQAAHGTPYVGTTYTFWWIGLGVIGFGISSYLKRRQ